MDRLIIRGGTVVDGTGRPGFSADVEIKGGIITAVDKDLPAGAADKVLDAEGFVVAPGFIDAHAHSDTMFLKDDSGASKLFQGITTEISGNCGSSPFPYPDAGKDDDGWRCASFVEFLRRFDREQRRMAVNQAMLVGHGSLRESVIGAEDRAPAQGELERMSQLLSSDLERGAWGLSLGLEYAPGCFADTRELGFLAKTVREFDGIVTCHMRSEGLHIDEAIDELAAVGRMSGAHVHISHLKLDNHRVHGRAPEVWERIENIRKDGVNMTADVYPYTASSTTLTIRCPRWSLDGGDAALLKRLSGPRRQEIVEGIRCHYPDAARAETCLFSDDGGYWPEIVGKTLKEVAENYFGIRDYAEAAAQVIERTRAQAWCVFFVMSGEDMLYFLSRDVSVGSDGRAMSADPAKVGSKPHPRSYGAVAEFLRLAREKRLCTAEEALNRVTLKTALRFGMTDRGVIAAGKAADITVFDPETIAPRATYLDPVRTAQGVRHVVINGGVALEDFAQTDRRAGRFLLKPRG